MHFFIRSLQLESKNKKCKSPNKHSVKIFLVLIIFFHPYFSTAFTCCNTAQIFLTDLSVPELTSALKRFRVTNYLSDFRCRYKQHFHFLSYRFSLITINPFYKIEITSTSMFYSQSFGNK